MTKKLLFFASLLFVAICPACIWAQNKSEAANVEELKPFNQKKQVGSVFDAPVFNSLAWQTGEYLVQEMTVLDNVEISEEGEFLGGFLVEQRMMIRIAFDYSQKKFGTCKILKASVLDYENISNGNPRKHEVEYFHSGFANLESGRIYLNDSTNGYREAIVSKDRQLGPSDIAELEFLDLRGCWMLGPYTKKNFETAKEWSEILKRVELDHTYSKEHLTVKINAVSNLKNKYLGPFIKYRFDVESSMPVFHSEYSVRKSDRQKVGREDVAIKWSQLDGIYLPISLDRNGSFLGPWPIVSGEIPGNKNMKFHWFNINGSDGNEELVSKLFEPKTIEDKDQILQLVDPVISGASSLLVKPAGDATEKDDSTN